MKVVFTRLSTDGLHAVRVERGDGVVFGVQSGNRKGYVPHDMAHFVADEAFGVPNGFWGSVAAGALFKSLTLVEGKLRHDATARSKAVLKRNADALRVSEVLPTAPYDAVERGDDIETAFKALRRAWGSISTGPLPYGRTELARAIDAFAAARAQWAAVPVSEAMTLTWTQPVR